MPASSLVIPELQHRGLFRIAYEGKTLHENPGLPDAAVDSKTTPK